MGGLLFPFQFPLSPMMVLAVRIKHPLDVAVQCLMIPIRANMVGPPTRPRWRLPPANQTRAAPLIEGQGPPVPSFQSFNLIRLAAGATLLAGRLASPSNGDPN